MNVVPESVPVATNDEQPTAAQRIIAQMNQKFRHAEAYLKASLENKDVLPAMAEESAVAIKLPIDSVELLTGINGPQPTLDFRVKSSALKVIGEKNVSQATLELLSHIPALKEHFNFDGKSEKPAPTVFSYGPDTDTVDFRFALPEGVTPQQVVKEVLLLRQGAMLAQPKPGDAVDPNVVGSATERLAAQEAATINNPQRTVA